MVSSDPLFSGDVSVLHVLFVLFQTNSTWCVFKAVPGTIQAGLSASIWAGLGHDYDVVCGVVRPCLVLKVS